MTQTHTSSKRYASRDATSICISRTQGNVKLQQRHEDTQRQTCLQFTIIVIEHQQTQNLNKGKWKSRPLQIKLLVAAQHISHITTWNGSKNIHGIPWNKQNPGGGLSHFWKNFNSPKRSNFYCCNQTRNPNLLQPTFIHKHNRNMIQAKPMDSNPLTTEHFDWYNPIMNITFEDQTRNQTKNMQWHKIKKKQLSKLLEWSSLAKQEKAVNSHPITNPHDLILSCEM